MGYYLLAETGWPGRQEAILLARLDMAGDPAGSTSRPVVWLAFSLGWEVLTVVVAASVYPAFAAAEICIAAVEEGGSRGETDDCVLLRSRAHVCHQERMGDPLCKTDLARRMGFVLY